jgi:hypothetical protein
MSADALARLAADTRVRTVTELRSALLAASEAVLQNLAVDLVPSLFRNDYHGEHASSGPHWAHAYARPQVSALPTFLVRMQAGAVSADDAANLRLAMEGAGITQAALAIITDGPLTAGVRAMFGPLVPWLLDTDGLVNLMMNANVGVTRRVYETKVVDAAYFQR